MVFIFWKTAQTRKVMHRNKASQPHWTKPKKILMMLNLLLHTQHTILKHIYIHACACRKRLVHTLVVIGRTVHFSSSYSKHFWIKITHIQHTISLAYTHAHLANPINPTACLLLQRPLEFPKIMSLFSCLEY